MTSKAVCEFNVAIPLSVKCPVVLRRYVFSLHNESSNNVIVHF